MVSITVPAYNEEAQIRGLVESLLNIDYPKDRLELLIVSDASSDRTDEIVREYADQGVQLLRMPQRGGKTKAENAAADRLQGDIVVNTDASIRIDPNSLKPLVSVFRDPRVGLASGRDVSVGPGQSAGNVGESGYVGYEMSIRDLETRTGGIIGASGCFYAIRPELHRIPLPEALSRDFAAALHTIEHGFKAVSVPKAFCAVPRSTSLRKEYRRKVRTITRGMQTLWHKKPLLNPLTYGVHAWMLWSHKVARWTLPWAALAALFAMAVLAPIHSLAAVVLAGSLVLLLVAALGWILSERHDVPRVLSIPAFLVAGNLAAMHAVVRALSGDRDPTWEPTRRERVSTD
jgi:cellulose synthase/poly-beta-1,6-N-acetylglucosamine synthase-like glycosyltransferase